MEILADDKLVGALDRKSGRLVQPGPELEAILSASYPVSRGGSCHKGESRFEEVSFDELPLYEKIVALRSAGFVIRLASGQVYPPSNTS